MFYKKTKTQIKKINKKKNINKMKSRKLSYNIQKGGTIESLGTNNENYKLIVKYLNSYNMMYSKFMMNSLINCFSIFSTINWTSRIEYSSNNSESDSDEYSNIKEKNTKKPDNYYIKPAKNKFYNESIVTGLEDCKKQDSTFINIGMYSKFEHGFNIKCILYIKKEDTTNNFYIIFNYGESVNFYNYPLSIKKVTRFIYKKLNDKKVDNLVLFGFSMGGNIAQHVALELLKDTKERIKENKITLINLGMGNNLLEVDYNLILEKLEKRFLSFSVISSDELHNELYNDNTTITIDIDSVFYKGVFLNSDDEGFTLPTILINYVKKDDINNIKYYDYDYLKTHIKKYGKDNSNIKKPIIEFKPNRELHDFTILREYLCSCTNINK